MLQSAEMLFNEFSQRIPRSVGGARRGRWLRHSDLLHEYGYAQWRLLALYGWRAKGPCSADANRRIYGYAHRGAQGLEPI